ncbi:MULTISPECIES: DNA internalization-related competence protein ComEC/Rec2 [unclassified Thioalkalivibrio]|uniref:DNA internalization-related competence protein ComEC/Rec2 n=1 Tax=unclassified Thioalkalivibrio TaxID=2621013 RepID=UPI0003A0335B|nr:MULTISPECIES: DNA internalization-related competence protein ComEC/Rec2 [unclassified Thioalkalivibrio]
MMAAVLALIAGIWFFHQPPLVPAALVGPFTVVLPLAGVLATLAWLWAARRGSPFTWLPAALLGLLAGAWLAPPYAADWSDKVVGPEWSGKDVSVRAQVVNLPEHGERRSRFRVRVSETDQTASGLALDGRELRVSTFPARPAIEAGDRLQLGLRLRGVEGPRNPGGFDVAGWFYREGVHGSAVARSVTPLAGVQEETSGRVIMHRLRAEMRDRLERAAPDLRHPGLVQALVIGHRQAMTENEWQAFLHTGTNHLMAISGLHVALVAGFAGGVAGWLWSGLAPLRRVRRWLFMSVAGLLAAAGYAMLAGFSIPTQRALLMLVALTLALLSRREGVAWRALALAAAMVLIVHPPSVLAPGFWFSFGAVAVILLLLQGRIGATGWREGLRIQVVLAVAMLPLSLAWFQLGSWIAPVANLVAVPMVTLLILPLLLIGALLAGWWPAGGGLFLGVGDGLLALLVVTLEALAGIPLLVDQRHVPVAAALLGAVAVLLALQPLARRLMPWVAVAAVALVAPLRPDLAAGQWRVQVLDVGAGQATIVQTRGRALLIDAGPGREGGFSAGDRVVVPALRANGIRSLDALLVTHENAGHAGGVVAVREQMPVERTLRRSPAKNSADDPCVKGEQWTWDGVRFEVLHPPSGWNDDSSASCVLRVEGEGATLLVMGGLDGLGEAVMRRENPGFAVDLLVAPRTSNPRALQGDWLEQFPPGQVWAATTESGAGLPAEVRGRLEQRGIQLFETGRSGALSATSTKLDQVPAMGQARTRFWHPISSKPEQDIGESRRH